ncbi:MAG: HypC/HybG/HupF family hydrogenase formation chaperone [Duodenibacillus sp.]|jgi:hydrogenase expression/formation protein HypC|nr:HypC/HybG/HupF family hydrogenase formation chaperone [Duodenibacillus sp.]
MCLAVPAQIEEVLDDGMARCDLNGVQKDINVSLIADPKPGDWVIVHVGFALNRIDEAQAQETLKLLASMGEEEHEA